MKRRKPILMFVDRWGASSNAFDTVAFIRIEHVRRGQWQWQLRQAHVVAAPHGVIPAIGTTIASGYGVTKSHALHRAQSDLIRYQPHKEHRS